MAKKFGKILLGAAVLGGAAAAAYKYLKKKETQFITPETIDEDYDDFSGESEECSDNNYVSLTNDTVECVEEECVAEEPVFSESNPEEATSLPEEIAEPDTIEEFFDEEAIEQ